MSQPSNLKRSTESDAYPSGYPLPLDDPCGAASFHSLDRPKNWRAGCEPCGYLGVPMTKAAARAAVVQHSLGGRHRQMMRRRRLGTTTEVAA